MTVKEAIEIIKYAYAFNSENSPLTKALDVAIEALEEVEQYRALGTVKEIRIREAQSKRLSEGYLSDLTKLREYQSLGTVEELKEARKKQKSRREWYQKGYQDGLNADKWIPCEERLPKEYDSVFAKLVRMGVKGSGHEKESDLVLVTIKDKDGKKSLYRAKTYDGKWDIEWEKKEVGYNKVITVPSKTKVIAWQPLPQPYKKEGAE